MQQGPTTLTPGGSDPGLQQLAARFPDWTVTGNDSGHTWIASRTRNSEVRVVAGYTLMVLWNKIAEIEELEAQQ